MSKMPSPDPPFQYNSSLKIAVAAQKLREEYDYIMTPLCCIPEDQFMEYMERVKNFWNQQELFARSQVQICQTHLREGGQGLRFFYEFNLKEAWKRWDAMSIKKQEAIQDVETMKQVLQNIANAKKKENE